MVYIDTYCIQSVGHVDVFVDMCRFDDLLLVVAHLHKFHFHVSLVEKIVVQARVVARHQHGIVIAVVEGVEDNTTPGRRDVSLAMPRDNLIGFPLLVVIVGNAGVKMPVESSMTSKASCRLSTSPVSGLKSAIRASPLYWLYLVL